MRNIANGTSPYPLHKGDFFLLVILNGVKNLECIAQLSPFTRGIWIDAFFATLNNSSDPSLRSG